MKAYEPRLEFVSQYLGADLPPDPALDDIARLAAQVCTAPFAGVAIFHEEQTLLLGQHNLAGAVVSPESLPLDRTLWAEGVYQLPDARQDTSYGPAGLEIGGLRLRFFAGVAVQTPDGTPFGCLFVLDSSPRELSEAELEGLEALSHMVTTRLELTLHIRETHRAARARQRMEAALTVEKNFVAAVLDTVGALVVVFDPSGRVVRFNRACEIISGYRSADLVGKFAWEKLIPQEDVPQYIDGFERIRRGQFPTAFENHWLASDGSRRRISWSATALLDSQGEVAYIIATGIDVTVQRVAEDTIRQSEARYRQIVEGSLGLVCTHDLSGEIRSINQHGAQSFGREVAEVVGRNLADFTYPERRSLLPEYFSTLLRTGEAQGLMHMEHSNGEERVLAYRNRLVTSPAEPPYVLAFAVDVTEQIRAEEKLRAVMRQSNSVLESVGDGIYGIDLEGRVTVVNPAAAQMLGYRAEEMLGRDMHALTHHTRPDGTPYPVEDCPIRGSVQHLRTIRVAHEVFWRKDGTAFPVEYVARPQIEFPEGEEAGGAGGRAVGVVVAFTDISERDALDRLKDEFISTVSHELRTPLTSLRAALGLVAGGALDDRPEKSRQMMEIAIGNTDRLVRLVNDILDLERIGSGKADMHFLSCSIEEIFRRGIALLAGPASKSNLRFTIESNGVTVWADPDRILQTVSNLISNAIKFSEPNPDEPGEIRLSASYLSADEALIRVQDQGRGIPADKLEEVFERFKQIDASDSRLMGGTGLGLTICRSIVTQHGGRIWATSQPHMGSVFHFTLPTQPRRHLR